MQFPQRSGAASAEESGEMPESRKVNGFTFLEWVDAVDHALEVESWDSTMPANYALWHDNWECGTTPEHMAHALRKDAENASTEET